MLSDPKSQSSTLSEKNNDLQFQEGDNKLWKVFRSGIACTIIRRTGCLVRTGNATTRPHDVVLSCPCTPVLYCHGDHLYVVPFGEQGTPNFNWLK